MALPEVCVCYLLREGRDGTEVLLGRKRTGLGRGKVVAPGGKLEAGERPVDAAVREVEEEVGVRIHASSLQLVGELTYLFPHKPRWSQKSWAFVSREWEGPVRGSRELDPFMQPVDSIPLAEMWSDARHWLPRALAGEKTVATFTFGADLESVDEVEWSSA